MNSPLKKKKAKRNPSFWVSSKIIKPKNKGKVYTCGQYSSKLGHEVGQNIFANIQIRV